ncbi:NAD-dependent epimerase/dehydratase family protein [Polynucleobacter yangtzensis]|uniref:NAD-dependent epimerase/dehydratase domain-containing protein n=1 Tax=Polynucleobacter yangtzensis TaxID=1743159 RepID=A0ABM8CKU0_9BURK|nr:SDR family oxidoreductase [Polynucleobacter yangtzensis]BDT78444.1 hypothetical protein PKF032_03320 [Polynucleobacter yangtzensis]
MKSVFLAGATGLLGSAILTKLIEDSEISKICVLLHKNKLKIHSEKIHVIDAGIEIRSINLSGYDVVYNCVGEKVNDKNMYPVNVEYAIELLRQCIKHKVKTYVYFSSVGSYGAKRYSGKISESTPSFPKNYYEFTKKIAEDKLESECKNIRLLILQPSNILATSNTSSVLLPSLLKLLKNGIVLVIGRKDGWLNYVSDEYVANIALKLPWSEAGHFKFILNTPIKYRAALTILTRNLCLNPVKLVIPVWVSIAIYQFFNYSFKLFAVKFFDVIPRKIYEIDNNVYFQSEAQIFLEGLGKVDAVQLYQKIAERLPMINHNRYM